MGTTIETKTDIAILMQTDPLELTDVHLDQIIAEMRSRRHMFNSGGAKSVKPKTEKQKVVASLAAQLDLSDLKL